MKKKLELQIKVLHIHKRSKSFSLVIKIINALVVHTLFSQLSTKTVTHPYSESFYNMNVYELGFNQ